MLLNGLLGGYAFEFRVRLFRERRSTPAHLSVKSPLMRTTAIVASLLAFVACESPRKNQATWQDLQFQKACSEAGDKAYKELMQQYVGPARAVKYLSNHYNHKLNECLMAMEVADDSGSATIIFDAFEKTKIAEELDDFLVNSHELWKDGHPLEVTDDNWKWFQSLMSE